MLDGSASQVDRVFDERFSRSLTEKVKARHPCLVVVVEVRHQHPRRLCALSEHDKSLRRTHDGTLFALDAIVEANHLRLVSVKFEHSGRTYEHAGLAAGASLVADLVNKQLGLVFIRSRFLRSSDAIHHQQRDETKGQKRADDDRVHDRTVYQNWAFFDWHRRESALTMVLVRPALSSWLPAGSSFDFLFVAERKPPKVAPCFAPNPRGTRHNARAFSRRTPPGKKGMRV